MSYNDAMASVKSFIELIDQIKKLKIELNDTQKLLGPEFEKLNTLIKTIDEYSESYKQVIKHLENEIAGISNFKSESLGTITEFNNKNIKVIEKIASELIEVKSLVIEQIDVSFSNAIHQIEEKQKDIFVKIESISNQIKDSESNLHVVINKQGQTNGLLLGVIIFMIILLGVLIFV